MQHAWARRGLRAIVTGLILIHAGQALADAHGTATHPEPRPEAATLQTQSEQEPPQSPAGAADTEAATQGGTHAATAAPDGPQRGPVTGFPIPRYVSIKASEANARRGPSRSHRIDWVFQRRNMPVLVVAEHGHWRRIIDRDGAGGWVHYTLLSGERTAIVDTDMLPIHVRPDPDAAIRARAERDVIAELRECRDDWCEIEAGGFRGWVEVSGLWGVDPGETID